MTVFVPIILLSRPLLTGKGYLLTLSPAAGVGIIDMQFDQHINMSRNELQVEHEASAIASVIHHFKKGTSTWYRKTTEWFMMYLITELGATPRTLQKGYNAPSVMSAYDFVVRQLVIRYNS